jgi:hypothetical protein
VSDFTGQFKSFTDSLGHAAQSVMNKLDQWSFRMVVDNLKSSDYDVAKESIDQLVREKRPIGIPPLYFVSKLHPNLYIRELAVKALKEFGQDKEIEETVGNKSVDDATRALIDKYGNFRQ